MGMRVGTSLYKLEKKDPATYDKHKVDNTVKKRCFIYRRSVGTISINRTGVCRRSSRCGGWSRERRYKRRSWGLSHS